MKRADQLNLLKLIYTSGPLSRAALSRMTNIAPSQVTVVIREALRRGLLVEQGFAPSTGGRRQILLEANPSMAQLIGIDIGRFHIRTTVTDFTGKILAYNWLPTEPSKGRDRVLHVVHEEIRSKRQEFPKIAAIGISHSGVIDSKAGKVLFWPMVEGWDNTPLRQICEDMHGLPTFVEDSVRTMAIAETRFGHAKGLRNFVLVTIGMGIGSAIFFDGHMHTGRNGLAGELGHTTIEENGKRCSCGNRGCLELVSSGSAILCRVRDELERGVSSTLTKELDGNLDLLSVESIIAAAKCQDRLSESVLSEAGMHVGTALASVVNLLNPEKLILTGKVAQAGGEVFLNPLLYSLRHRSLPQAAKDLQLVISEIGEEAATLGMILIAGEEVLKMRWVEPERKHFKPGTNRRAGKASNTDNQSFLIAEGARPAT
jgi:predicted NBD/HSP70 family sugar kinase